MVKLDISMPKCCFECALLMRSGELVGCNIYPRRYISVLKVMEERPDWCPIIAEIIEKKDEN